MQQRGEPGGLRVEKGHIEGFLWIKNTGFVHIKLPNFRVFIGKGRRWGGGGGEGVQ